MLAACLAALALTSPVPLDDHGYLAVADRIQRAFDPLWDEAAGPTLALRLGRPRMAVRLAPVLRL